MHLLNKLSASQGLFLLPEIPHVLFSPLNTNSASSACHNHSLKLWRSAELRRWEKGRTDLSCWAIWEKNGVFFSSPATPLPSSPFFPPACILKSDLREFWAKQPSPCPTSLNLEEDSMEYSAGQNRPSTFGNLAEQDEERKYIGKCVASCPWLVIRVNDRMGCAEFVALKQGGMWLLVVESL